MAESNLIPPTGPPPGGQLLIYREGLVNLHVRLDGQTVWLTQRQIADLYQTTIPNINQHLTSIYEDGELPPEATIKRYLIVQTEGTRQVRRLVDHYNLDAVLAVGYRVRSSRGTQFRQWATQQLSQLLIKGFVLDDERIKAGRTIGQDYFEELLARIREHPGIGKIVLPEGHRSLRHEHRLRPRRRCHPFVLRNGAEQTAMGDPLNGRARLV
jgi:hypothetical protein